MKNEIKKPIDFRAKAERYTKRRLGSSYDDCTPEDIENIIVDTEKMFRDLEATRPQREKEEQEFKQREKVDNLAIVKRMYEAMLKEQNTVIIDVTATEG